MNAVGKQLIEQNGSYSNNNVDKTAKRKTKEVRGVGRKRRVTKTEGRVFQ